MLRHSEFDKLLRFVTRHQTLTLALPAAAQLPPVFVKALLDLESQIASASAKEKESGKKMNASNAKSLNGMKQKVKKAMREYEAGVQAYAKVRRECCIKVGLADASARRTRRLSRRPTRPPLRARVRRRARLRPRPSGLLRPPRTRRALPTTL